MKQITNIRKAVCAMANQLKKAGYSLSEAFRKAWGGGCKSLLPFSFTGNPAASIAHNMRGMLENVGFSLYWQYGSSRPDSCK